MHGISLPPVPSGRNCKPFRYLNTGAWTSGLKYDCFTKCDFFGCDIKSVSYLCNPSKVFSWRCLAFLWWERILVYIQHEKLSALDHYQEIPVCWQWGQPTEKLRGIFFGCFYLILETEMNAYYSLFSFTFYLFSDVLYLLQVWRKTWLLVMRLAWRWCIMFMTSLSPCNLRVCLCCMCLCVCSASLWRSYWSGMVWEMSLSCPCPSWRSCVQPFSPRCFSQHAHMSAQKIPGLRAAMVRRPLLP